MANSTPDHIIMYGATWCSDCRRAKEFFGRYKVPYEYIDIDARPEFVPVIEEINNGMRSIPVILFPDGNVLVEPSNQELADQTGVDTRAGSAYKDVIIIGGGPAGLSAAIYTAREGLETLVLDASGVGGQAAVTQFIENYPGFDEGITGADFSERLYRQAMGFDVEIIQGEKVTDITRQEPYLIVKTINGAEYIGRSVLIATGSQYRKLSIPGESELVGRNVHFCATCDGAFYRDKDVLVIGGGNSGFEEGIFLTKFAKSVTIVEYMPEVKASKILQDKVAGRDDMRVVTNAAVREFTIGEDGKLAGVLVEDRATGSTEVWNPDGIFVFVGLEPNTGFLPDTIQLDDYGFITADDTLQTSLPGVFAAGDVRRGSTKQIISAAGEGATAALMIRQYLQRIGDRNPHNTVEQEALVTAETA